VITEIAAAIGIDRVTVAISRPQAVWLDGQPVQMAPGQTIFLGAGNVTELSASSYSIVWNTGETLIVTNNDDYLDANATFGPGDASSPPAGLLGPDLTLPDGTTLNTPGQPLTTEQLYGQFANAWRVLQANSLLDYGPGQSTVTFTDPNFPEAPITLADLPTSVFAPAAQAVAAAGITDPGAAAAAEFDYIASGGEASVLADDASVFVGLSTTPAAITESSPPPATLGVTADKRELLASTSQPTAVTFDLYLTSAAESETPVDWAVIAPFTDNFTAASFGGTLPSGQVTITAGQTSAQFAVNLPLGALGTAPNENLEVQISAPDGTPILAPTATATVIAPPEPGPPAVSQLASLTNLGTFTQNGNHYTLDLGQIGLGQPLPALQFAVENTAASPADQLGGTFDVANVAGFTVTGASLPMPIDAAQNYDGLTADIATGAFGSTAPIKFGFNEETITYHPQDTNPSGYSGALPDLTLTINYDLVQSSKVFSYAYGDVHILTYNGLHYDFQATGDFTLAKSRVPGDSFDIQLRLQPWYSGASVSVITQVAVSVGNDRVIFDWSRPNTVMVDGAAAALSLSNPTLTLADGKITELSPDAYTATWNTGETATFSRGPSFVGYFINVADSVPVGLPGFIAGLQGEDEGQANDFQLADGTVLPQPLTSAQLYGEYATAWAVTSADSLFDTPAIPPSAPTDPLTLANLPQNVVNQAAQLVAAAGITDPNIAADAELDYLATGDPAFIASAESLSQQAVASVAATVMPSTTPAAALGVMAAQTNVTEAASGSTPVTFEIYLTSAQTGDTPVNYAVIAPKAGDLNAATFGGTFPSGQVTIPASQTSTQFTINVPQEALGTFPSEDLEVQINSPGSVPVFAPTAQTEIVNNQSEAGSPAILAIAELSGQGSLTHNGSTYTLSLGTLTHGQLLQPLQFAIINAATAPADSLGGAFGVPIGNGFIVTGNNLTTPIAAGQSYQGLFFSEQTNVDGAHSETLTFTPAEVNDNGYSQTLGPQITLAVTDTVEPAAQGRTNTPATVFFPNVRVATPESQEVSVTNTATPGAANLDVSLTGSGDATASGSISGLAPGATDYTDLAVGLNTGSGGAKGGSVIETFTSDLGGGNTTPVVPSSYIDVFGSVYREATASIAPTNGIVHIGDPGTGTLTVANTDAADGYSENLIATLASTSGSVGVAGGPTGEIAAGANDKTTFTATFSTAQAGTVSGNATFNLTSDGGTGTDSIDGLGQVALPQATVPLNITVNNYANPVFEEISGGGTVSQNGANYTLDLGTITQGSGSLAVNLGVLNNVTGPADLLSGTLQTSGSSAFTLSGFAAFSGLAAGQADTAPTVTLDTSRSGAFGETITFSPTGSNASGYSQALGDETLTIEGTIAPAASVLNGTVTLSAAIEGTALPSSTTVATFTDTNTGDNTGNFTATINWGDGAQATTGAVTGSNGSFLVAGGHTYADEGSDTLSVTIAETNGATITPSGTVKVADARLSATAGNFSATEGMATGTVTVASFTDANPSAAAGDFTATINWGDGSPPGTGTVTGSNGSFTVTGGHTYADEGKYTVSVAIIDDGGSMANPTSTATVAEGDSLTPHGTTIAATVNTPFSGAVASFSDSYTGNVAGDFTATINWGDGSPVTTSTVSGGNGTFTVSGSHTYTTATTDTVSVTLTEDMPGTGSAMATSIANVANVTPKGFFASVPDAAGYAVLSEGTGNRLHLANATVNGNVGVGGTSALQFDGPAVINGHLDFAAANNGQYKDNGNNTSATSVNYQAAAVTSALNEVNVLSETLGAEKGTNIAISGSMTINASAGTLDASGNRVFNVTSYNEHDGNVVTINGDAAGDSVVFNFGFSSNVNLDGNVTLAGGLSDDQVLWNFTTSGKHIDLNNNAASDPLPVAFHGIILAPLDNLSMENSNLDGRLWGGGSGNNMQLTGGDILNDFVPALSTNYWSGHHNASGVQWDEATLAGFGKGVLLGDYTGTAWEGGGTATAPQMLAAVPAGMLFVPDAAAGQLINATPSATDVRAALLSQAIAAQLNIDTGIGDPGYSSGTPPNGHDLVGEAVKWLSGQAPFQYADGSTGNVDANHDGILETGTAGSAEYNTATSAFTSKAQLTGTAEWSTYVDPVNAPPKTGDITVSGQDLNKALTAFNATQLVTAMNGFEVGWNNNGVAGDMHPNTGNAFWTVLKDQHVIAGPLRT
jgi:hypothetical protein